MSANYPRLCGGTFFCLMLRAVKNHARSDVTHSHGFDGYSQRELLRGLLRVLYLGDFYRAATTLEAEATRFKHCENIFPIEKCDSGTLIEFDLDVKDGGYRSGKVMSDIVAHFFDDPLSEDNNLARKERLVKSILQLIREDESIQNDQEFYVRGYEEPFSKQVLSVTVDFCFTSFLLGIWHYCMTKARNNVVGKETYQSWFPNGDKEFVSSIGQAQRKINLLPEKPKAVISIGRNEVTEKPDTMQPAEESTYYHPYFEAVARSIGRVNTILRSEAYDFESFYVPAGLGSTMHIVDLDLDTYNPIELIRYTILMYCPASQTCPAMKCSRPRK